MAKKNYRNNDSDILKSSEFIVKVTRRIAFGLITILGVAIIFLTIWFCSHYFNGFFNDSEEACLNWHQLTMTVSYVVLVGNGEFCFEMNNNDCYLALLVYRYLIPKISYDFAKVIHLTLLCFAFSFSIIGLIQIFRFHQKIGAPDLSTVHSWLGFLTELLTLLQLLTGQYAFIYPGLTAINKLFKPFHSYFGIVLFILMIVTIISGLTMRADIQFQRNKHNFNRQPYSELPNEAILLNTIGILIILFAFFVLFIATNFDFNSKIKRF
ncbi:Cytochrome b561-like protein [Leptotrombidium deliense]|uniref:Cytochrome b561-like protein n=1 Tax=Leptotrombidium deliense TaxID=299467 RepID=A0A443SC74_9ACAR|nr:Cytochrome b561-like protein [Leptotrombidium deliense]